MRCMESRSSDLFLFSFSYTPALKPVSCRSGYGPARSQAGLSLIEVLVTLVLVSISVLGVMSVQARSVQLNQLAYNRSQAVNLAYDMAERMRVNAPAVRNGNYQLAFADSPVAAASLAATDLFDWTASLATFLPQGDGEIVVEANNLATITVRWVFDRRVQCQINAIGPCGEEYTLQVQF